MRYKKEVCDRIKEVALYVVETHNTVRQAATEFQLSKSCIHNYLTKKLQHVDPTLVGSVRLVLDVHLEERAVKGGNSTKLMWQMRRGN